MTATEFTVEIDKNNRLRLKGALDLYHISEARRELEKPLSEGRVIVDLSGLTKLDSAGALLLIALSENKQIKFENPQESHKAIFDLVSQTPSEVPPPAAQPSSFVLLTVHLGRRTIKLYHDTIELVTFFGQACSVLMATLMRPARLRMGAINHHIEHIGIHAVPIVSLIAFLISIVLAYQGVEQLKPFGAELFTANLVAISVLREMGVLLTAIMVAGRSGSAFTAEIGVMKLREEIDALRTIGLDPFEILVVPRLIAIIIVLPLLTFIANIMGLFGGAVLSHSLIDLSFPEFINRIHHAVTWKTFFVGMVKAPVFAIAIGVVGCLHGMKVSGSSESVGTETTASVVKAIFLVLMLDALFSILFQKLGI